MQDAPTARLLAPLALFAAVLMIFLVARPELSGSGSASSTSSNETTSSTRGGGSSTTSTTSAKPKPKPSKPKTYTVKPGDVLGAIAAETGVSVTDLIAYNDGLDASSLSVGQKLKLAP